MPTPVVTLNPFGSIFQLTTASVYLPSMVPVACSIFKQRDGAHRTALIFELATDFVKEFLLLYKKVGKIWVLE